MLISSMVTALREQRVRLSPIFGVSYYVTLAALSVLSELLTSTDRATTSILSDQAGLALGYMLMLASVAWIGHTVAIFFLPRYFAPASATGLVQFMILAGSLAALAGLAVGNRLPPLATDFGASIIITILLGAIWRDEKASERR